MRRRFVLFCAFTALFYTCSILTTCSQPITVWEQINYTGKLRVVTRDNPATYFITENGPEGFEYDLIQQFAEQLGLEVDIYTAPVKDIISEVKNGRAQIAAAGLTVTPARLLEVEFGPIYQTVEQLVVGRRARGIPRSQEKLSEYTIGVLANSSHVDRLVQIKQSFPQLIWEEENTLGTMSLLKRVENEGLDLTVIDSNEFAVAQRYFPNLAKAFTLSEPENLAWALSQQAPQLRLKVYEFFASLEESGDMDTLKEMHFGFVQAFDYVELVSFMRNSKQRLPEFEKYFKLAAQTYSIDWQLLASIAYQESHWNPDAVSPTGVKGIMMLTKRAAIDVNVADRKDPKQSIIGGTRYFLKVRNKIPGRIQEPDRTWLALAGYNIGMGHLEDARVLTDRAGKNPDSWVDVREYLPLLSEEKYYSTVRHGKARGSEPVKYVDNIRDYYDLLKWQQRTNSLDEVLPDSAPPDETTTAEDSI